jgi:hypothetical protein
MDGAKKNLNSFNRDIENFQTKTVAVAAAAGTALLAVGTAAYMAGSAIDDALDTIRMRTGQTGEALAGLEGDFKRVFASVPDDAGRASQAIAELSTRTGQTGPGLQALATQVLTLSRLTKSDLGSTIASTTRLFGDWSIAVDKQAGTLDQLFRASQATGIGVDKLAGQMVQFGAPLRQLGFSFEESAALMASFERDGVNAELVLGSLRRGLSNFAKEGKDAPTAIRAVIAEIQRLGPGAKATALAMATFGSKAGPDMAAAITEGRFAIDTLMGRIKDGEETVSSAAKATDGLSETLARLRNTATQQLGTWALPGLERLNELLVQAMQNGSGVQVALYRVTQAVAVLASVALGRMVPAFVASTAAIVAKGVALLVLAGRAGVASLALRGLSTVLAWFGGPWGIAATAVLAGVGLAFLKTGRNARQAAHDAETAADTFRRVLGELDKATLELQYRSNAALTSQAARNRQAAQATLDSLGALKLPETEWVNGPADGMVVERVTEHGRAIRAARAQLEQWTAAERRHSQSMLAAGEEINRRNAALEAVGPPPKTPEIPTVPEVDPNASKASGQQAARTLFDSLESEWERLRHSVALAGLQVGGTDSARLQLEFEHATRMLDIDRQRLQAERAAGIITQQELTDGLRTLEIRRQLATAERDQMSAALTANATREAGLERQDTLLNDALERERLLGAVALTRLGTAGNHAERLAVQLRTLESTYELQRAAIVADTRLSDLQRENELFRLDAAHDREQLQLRMNAAAEEELRIIEKQTAARKKSADAQRQLLEGALQLGASAASGASGAQLGAGAGSLLGNFLVPGAGGIVGGMLGGMFGGLFDKGQKEAPPVVRQLDAIERAQRDTISTIQAQTESLLNPANRFLNLPTDFSVPSYNPGSASGGTTVTYGDTNVHVTFTISSSTSPDEIRRYAMEGISEALDGRNRSWSTKEFV